MIFDPAILQNAANGAGSISIGVVLSIAGFVLNAGLLLLGWLGKGLIRDIRGDHVEEVKKRQELAERLRKAELIQAERKGDKDEIIRPMEGVQKEVHDLKREQARVFDRINNIITIAAKKT